MFSLVKFKIDGGINMDELATLRPKLTRLKLNGILEILEERIREAMDAKWSYSHFLETLLSDETDKRDHWMQSRRLSVFGLDPDKTFETFDFTFNTQVYETTLKEMARCRFIEDKGNIFFLGPAGVGKTHLAQAIGHEACRNGFSTLFHRTYSLFQWIYAGNGDGSHKKRLDQIIKIPLLILDDFGLQPLTSEMQNDLYEVICGRYEKAATIITSNRDFDEWLGIFDNPLMGSAGVDRLIDRASKIIIEGKSYRMENYINKTKSLTKTGSSEYK